MYLRKAIGNQAGHILNWQLDNWMVMKYLTLCSSSSFSSILFAFWVKISTTWPFWQIWWQFFNSLNAEKSYILTYFFFFYLYSVFHFDKILSKSLPNIPNWRQKVFSFRRSGKLGPWTSLVFFVEMSEFKKSSFIFGLKKMKSGTSKRKIKFIFSWRYIP